MASIPTSLFPLPLPPHAVEDYATYTKLKAWSRYSDTILQSMQLQISSHELAGETNRVREWTMVHNCVRDGFEQILHDWLTTYSSYTNALYRLSTSTQNPLIPHLPLPLASSSASASPRTAQQARPLPRPQANPPFVNPVNFPAPVDRLTPMGMTIEARIKRIRKGIKEMETLLKNTPKRSEKPLPALPKRSILKKVRFVSRHSGR